MHRANLKSWRTISMILVALACADVGYATEYKIINLSNFGGYVTTPPNAAYGINNSHEVVGYSRMYKSDHRACRWYNGVVNAVWDFGYVLSEARAIDSYGTIVGWFDTDTGERHAFHFARFFSPEMADLGTLGGYRSEAYGINDDWLIVGLSENSALEIRGFEGSPWWIYELTTLGGRSEAYGVNNLDEIVGCADTGYGSFHACIWRDFWWPEDMGTLGGSSSCAFSINDSSHVVGGSFISDGQWHAFLWDGQMKDLGTLGGSSEARSINEDGQVVGWSEIAGGGVRHAFLWEDDVMIDLNRLLPAESGWVLNEAHGINDRGQIVGGGTYEGATCAFLLSPVNLLGILQGTVYDKFTLNRIQGATVRVQGQAEVQTENFGRFSIPDLLSGPVVYMVYKNGYHGAGWTHESITENSVTTISISLAQEKSPLIRDVIVTQRADAGKFVDIFYNLEDADADKCFVSVKVSDDGGSTYSVPASNFTGDVGSGIAPGTAKCIIWDSKTDLPDAYGANYKVAVTASDGLASYTGYSNIFTIDNRGESVIQVYQRAQGIFLSGVSFNNTFKAVVNDWKGGSPGSVTFTLNGQSVTIPYGPDGAETSAFDMGTLPSGECAVTSNMLVCTKNSSGTVVGQSNVSLRCIDRPWFIPPPAAFPLPGTIVRVPLPNLWSEDIKYEAIIKFVNLDATWYGSNVVFENYGGQFSNAELKIEYNGAKGEFTSEIKTELSAEPKPKFGELKKPVTHKEKFSWGKERNISMNISAKAKINLSTGCFEGGPVICGEATLGYEWKLVPIGPLFAIPGLWFTGKAGLDINPTLCFDFFKSRLDNPSPFTALDVDLNLIGQGGLELGIPYFLSVFGGPEFDAGGKIHVAGDPVPTCWDLPFLADLHFDLSIVGYARAIFSEWELGRYDIYRWSCPTSGIADVLVVPMGKAVPTIRKAGRPYLSNGEPYSQFIPQTKIISQGVILSGSGGETDEPVVVNVNLEATPSLAGRGNLILLATSEDDPSTAQYVEHDIHAVFRDGAAWGTEVTITNNNVPDILPTTGFDASGKAIIAWTTVPGVTGTENFNQVKTKMEIAYSKYDSVTGSWSSPIQLTSNGSLDALSQIVNGADGSTSLIWLRSNDNSLPVAPGEPLGTPPDIMTARWNGSSFGTPQVLFTACDSVGPVRYTRDSVGREFLIWTRDIDGDLQTYEEREVVESHTVGGNWTSPQALTSNGYGDIAVGLLCSGTDVIAYYVRLRSGGSPSEPEDQLIAKVFNGSVWSSESVQVTAPSILSPSFVLSPANAVTCIYVGPSNNESGKAIFYTSSSTGLGNWAQPQEMATGPAPTAPACAYAANNLQVTYVSARSSAKSTLKTFAFETQTDTAFDVRFLEHQLYTDIWTEESDIVIEPNDPNVPLGGQPVKVSVKVHLSGDHSQTGVTVNVYDGDPCEGGILIDSNTTDLAPGGSSTLEFAWTYPSDFAGHIVYCKVDPNNLIAELNENNNTASMPAGTVNLEASSVHSAFSENQLVGVSVAFKNTGNTDLQEVALEIRRDSETGPVIMADIVPTAPAGETVEVIVPWDVSLTSPGVYNVFLLLDPYGKVSEENEFDNQSQGGVAVLPDLKIEDPNINRQNETTEITVRNIGAKPSSPTTVRIVFNKQVLDEVTVESLGPRESSDILMSIAGCATSMPITFTVNPDSNGLDEVTLQNNTVAGIIYSPADFEPDGDVDYRDLAELAHYWLQNEPSVDIAPQPTGDGIVNFKDITLFADHWLEGTTP